MKFLEEWGGPIGAAVGGVAGGIFGGPEGAMFGTSAGGSMGGMFGAQAEDRYQKQLTQQQMDLQKEFAQSGLTWKVNDAARVGISPLAAIGAQGYNYSPVTAGVSTRDSNIDYSGMGQNLSRAMDATANEDQRAITTLQKKSLEEDVRGKKLDNALRANELVHKARNPPMPSGRNGKIIPGQGDAPSKTKIHALRDYYKSPQGGYGSLLSGDVKSAVEDTPREWAIDVRDMAHQQINPHSQRFLGKLPKNRKGIRYSFNYPTQEYIEVPENASIWERMGRHSSFMWK